MAFNITYNSVEQAGNQLRLKTQELSRIVEDMRKRSQELFAIWEGQAETVYQEVQSKWSSQAGVMNGDLEVNVKRLEQIVLNYQNADRQAAKI